MKNLGFFSAVTSEARALGAGCHRALQVVSELGEACVPVVRGALRGGIHVLRDQLARHEQEGLGSHARLAGVVACAASVAQCFASPGPALLVKIGGALVVAGIAVSVACRVARRHSASSSWTDRRDLLRSTVRQTVPRHGGSWAVMALSVVCESPGVWSDQLRSGVLDRVRGTVDGVRNGAWGSVVRPIRSVLPGIGAAWAVADAFDVKAQNELFVRDFEAAATALCTSEIAIATA